MGSALPGGGAGDLPAPGYGGRACLGRQPHRWRSRSILSWRSSRYRWQVCPGCGLDRLKRTLLVRGAILDPFEWATDTIGEDVWLAAINVVNQVDIIANSRERYWALLQCLARVVLDEEEGVDGDHR